LWHCVHLEQELSFAVAHNIPGGPEQPARNKTTRIKPIQKDKQAAAANSRQAGRNAAEAVCTSDLWLVAP